MKYRINWADIQPPFYHLKLLSQFKFMAVFVFLFMVLTVFALSQNVIANQSGTASGTIVDTPTEDLATALFSNQSTNGPATAQAKEYISPEYKTDFRFNGVGLTWNGNESADVEFYISIDDGDWMIAPMLDHEAKDQAEAFTSYPVFTSGNRVRYKIVGTDIALVRSVRLIYFDSTPLPDPPSTLQVIQQKLQLSRDTENASPTSETELSPEAKSNVKIIPRSEWGADENIRFWAPEYTAPEFFILHHTAGNDGGDNPAATIRGIYYWHTTVLGWGDIGYNYLVDPQGNVYEGRYGGEGVIGAHAYNAVTDTNYNQFSIGITMLGCFESTEGACNTVHQVTPEMNQAVIQLIARKAKLHTIDPHGTNEVFGRTVKNIVGHRDVDQTYCPGNTIHDDLKSIRGQVADAITQLNQNKPLKFQAQPMAGGFSPSYQTTEAPRLSLTYRNIGLYTWNPDEVELRVAVRKTKKRQSIPLVTEVLKQNETQFNFQWTEIPFHSGTYIVTTKLFRNEKSIKQSAQRHTVTITNPYQATVIKDTVPIAIQQLWSPMVKITFQNSGTIAWPAETQLIMNGEIVSQLAEPVEPGQAVRLKARINKNHVWQLGTQTILGYLQVGTTRIEGSRFIKNIRID